MVWKDFLGHAIQVGDDVIVIADNRLRTGIVLDMNDLLLTVSYNWFMGEKEYEQKITYPNILVDIDGTIHALMVLKRK